MARVVIENTGKNLMFVGSHIVPAGETRDFDERDVPAAMLAQLRGEKPRVQQSLAEAIARAAAQSLPGGEYHGQEDYVVGGISAHYKADVAEVRKALREEIAKVEAVEAAAAAAKHDAALAELAAKGVKEIGAAIPALSDEDLGKLEALEKAKESPRKTVLEAIAEEILKRAAEDDPKAGGE